jgi:hypothetical protein
VVAKSSLFYDNWEVRERRRKLESQYPLQGHALDDITFFQEAPTLKVSILAQ